MKQKSILKTTEILKQIKTASLFATKKESKTYFKYEILCLATSGIIIIISFLLLILNNYLFKNIWIDSLGFYGFIIGSISFLLILTFIGIAPFSTCKEKINNKTYTIFLNNAFNYTTTNYPIFDDLCTQPKSTLQLLKLELQSEINRVKFRSASFIGLVERVGIFPLFLPTAALILKIYEKLSFEAISIIVLFPMLGLIASYTNWQTMKMEKLVEVINLVIDCQDSKKQSN